MCVYFLYCVSTLCEVGGWGGGCLKKWILSYHYSLSPHLLVVRFTMWSELVKGRVGLSRSMALIAAGHWLNVLPLFPSHAEYGHNNDEGERWRARTRCNQGGKKRRWSSHEIKVRQRKKSQGGGSNVHKDTVSEGKQGRWWVDHEKGDESLLTSRPQVHMSWKIILLPGITSSLPQQHEDCDED